MRDVTARGLIIGAPRSGAGKTTMTLALLAAVRRRGVAVRAAKAGPDYIDTAFHAAATGKPSFNLDTWAMAPDDVSAVAAMAVEDAEILIVESAMGLFDGVAAAAGRTGSGADLAARLGLPVLLVLDVAGQAQTAAAVARGFIGFAPDVTLAGVVLNQLGSARHRAGIETAMAATGLPILGAVPRDGRHSLPARHLGLVQAEEHPHLRDRLDGLADLAEKHLDINAILRLAAPLRNAGGAPRALLPPPGQRIALARDQAFSFVYAHHLQAWRRAGCEVVAFSPLADEPPPQDCDMCWLPGGYPELHAGTLAGALRFQAGLRRFAKDRPVHGECGGYMVLGAGLEDAEGARHPMAGLLGHSTSFAKRRLNLGYRRATLRADTVLGRAETCLRGHEFHYASVIEPGADDPLASLQDGQGQDLGAAGGRRGNVTGSFFHVIASDG